MTNNVSLFNQSYSKSLNKNQKLKGSTYSSVSFKGGTDGFVASKAVSKNVALKLAVASTVLLGAGKAVYQTSSGEGFFEKFKRFMGITPKPKQSPSASSGSGADIAGGESTSSTSVSSSASSSTSNLSRAELEQQNAALTAKLKELEARLRDSRSTSKDLKASNEKAQKALKAETKAKQSAESALTTYEAGYNNWNDVRGKGYADAADVPQQADYNTARDNAAKWATVSGKGYADAADVPQQADYNTARDALEAINAVGDANTVLEIYNIVNNTGIDKEYIERALKLFQKLATRSETDFTVKKNSRAFHWDNNAKSWNQAKK